MKDRTLARIGLVACLLLIAATWHKGDYAASVWFGFCVGFFHREQLVPTDGADSTTGKAQDTQKDHTP